MLPQYSDSPLLRSLPSSHYETIPQQLLSSVQSESPTLSPGTFQEDMIRVGVGQYSIDDHQHPPLHNTAWTGSPEPWTSAHKTGDHQSEPCSFGDLSSYLTSDPSSLDIDNIFPTPTYSSNPSLQEQTPSGQPRVNQSTLPHPLHHQYYQQQQQQQPQPVATSAAEPGSGPSDSRSSSPVQQRCPPRRRQTRGRSSLKYKKGIQRQCSNCGTKKTTMWRYCGEGEEEVVMCNPCGLYWKRNNGAYRPVREGQKDKPIRRRKRSSSDRSPKRTRYAPESKSVQNSGSSSTSTNTSTSLPNCLSVDEIMVAKSDDAYNTGNSYLIQGDAGVQIPQLTTAAIEHMAVQQPISAEVNDNNTNNLVGTYSTPQHILQMIQMLTQPLQQQQQQQQVQQILSAGVVDTLSSSFQQQQQQQQQQLADQAATSLLLQDKSFAGHNSEFNCMQQDPELVVPGNIDDLLKREFVL